MWGGGGGIPPPQEDENARLAASALAAYSTTSGAADPSSSSSLYDQGFSTAEREPLTVHEHHQAREKQMEAAETTTFQSSHGVNVHEKPAASAVAFAAVEEQHPQQLPITPLKPRGKPEAMAKALGEARLKREEAEAARKKTSKKRKKPSSSSPNTHHSPSRKSKHNHFSMDDAVDPITNNQYQELDKLMEQFCKVPLLAEFSRPVALLHPELVPVYSKLVTRPIDMGKVCRSIRKRKYKNVRSVRLDMWRIFCNCIKYHTHPSNKERAVPSFVSIALHLREYFNALWQEYMLPSDVPLKATKAVKLQYEQRLTDRNKRFKACSATFMSAKALEKTAAAIREFLANGGRVDSLDTVGVLEMEQGEEELDDETQMDLEEVVSNLQRYKKRLMEIASAQESQQEQQEDYTVLDFVTDYKKCYTSPDLFENKPSLKQKVRNRLDRIMGKTICPIYEANGRGVTQSSIWGCMAAAIWARESSKKPFWPALVLGIMAPDDQREDWHAALTYRNEERLPEKLRAELQAGRKKAEQALKRFNQGVGEQQSFFLVEFMGTHEFIWVKESDIIESFDPDDDPNANIAAGNVTKKKRSARAASHDVTKSKTYATAIEEARWALEEFELQLNDTCGDLEEADADSEDEEEQGYSFTVLCQSDEEAEEVLGGGHEEYDPSPSELDEANELLATDGLLDFSAAGRKEAKKRAAARKKQRQEVAKAAAKKEKAEQKKLAAKKSKAAAKKKKGTTPDASAKKAQREERKLEKELERKRRKRARERERVQKEELRKKKRRRTDTAEKGIPEKRARAKAIVKGYLRRLARTQDLSLTPVMQIPSSTLDTSGLLGMALAFRAAAGELTISDQDPSFLNKKPYDLIDTTSPKSASEREKLLEQQIELMKEEAERLKKRIATREHLTELALEKKEEIYHDIMRQEAEAKKTDVKKRKKYAKKAATPKKKKPEAEATTPTKEEREEAATPPKEEKEEVTPITEQAAKDDATNDNVDDDDDDDKTEDGSKEEEIRSNSDAHSHDGLELQSHGDADAHSHNTEIDMQSHDDGINDHIEEEAVIVVPPGVAVSMEVDSSEAVDQFDDAEEDA